MEELLKKAKINDSKLNSLVVRIVSKELSNLAEPCYYPELKKYYYELLYICQLKETDIKAFVKGFWAGMPQAKWHLQTDNVAMFYLFLTWYMLKTKNKTGYFAMSAFIGIRYYTNQMHRQIKTCNPRVFKLTLERLSKTHLFSREKTVSNAIIFLSKQIQKKWADGLLAQDKDIISKRWIQEYRGRLSQSIKKFAELYYRLHESGEGIRQPYEDGDGATLYKDIERTTIVVNETIKKITVYKHVDTKAINDARNISKISAALATSLAKSLTDTKYSDEIKIVLESFLLDVKSVKELCGHEYIAYVKKLMAIRRSNKPNFKFYVHVLLLLLLKDIRHTKKYESLTKQTQFLIDTYLAYYVTMVMRNIIC